jgi:hypothetical protein
LEAGVVPEQLVAFVKDVKAMHEEMASAMKMTALFKEEEKQKEKQTKG